MNPLVIPPRLRLLVSVRDAAEARLAAPWVDILDLKNPDAGPLGAVDAEVLRQVLAMRPQPPRLSVALGELSQVAEELIRLLGREPGNVCYAKVGLAGWAQRADWTSQLGRLRRRLPPEVELIPAAYADWQRVQAPEPWRVLDSLAELRCGTFMLDTAVKDGLRLWDHLAPEQVKRLVQEARCRGHRVVLAGSLRAEDVPLVRRFGAEVLAVRGAVCRRGRDRLEPGRLRLLAERLQCPGVETKSQAPAHAASGKRS